MAVPGKSQKSSTTTTQGCLLLELLRCVCYRGFFP